MSFELEKSDDTGIWTDYPRSTGERYKIRALPPKLIQHFTDITTRRLRDRTGAWEEHTDQKRYLELLYDHLIEAWEGITMSGKPAECNLDNKVKLAQLFLCLFCVRPIRVAVDQLPQIVAAHFAELLHRQSSFLATIKRDVLIAALPTFALRKPETACTGHPQNLFDLREVWVAGNDLLAALQCRNVSLLQLEVVLRDFQIVMRVSFEIGVAER